MLARVLVGMLTLSAVLSAQTTWYVDDDAPNDPGPGDNSISDPLEDGTAAHPFDMVQEGIVAAKNGDTVLVLSGTYVENIDFIGKPIVVRSSQGPEATIIDGNGSGSTVSFRNREGRDSIIAGFTITNGFTEPFGAFGAGISCEYSSPTITSNVISENVGEFGGGIGLVGSSARVVNNSILANTADWDGGGIYCMPGTPIIANNVISGNTAAGSGGGIDCGCYGLVAIGNCLITGNTAWRGGGVACNYDVAVEVTNCTITENTASFGGGIDGEAFYPIRRLAVGNTIVVGNSAEWGSQIYAGLSNSVSYSCIQGGWSGTGNISADPLFVDPAHGDYRLRQEPCQPGVFSPCVDSGDPASIMIAGSTRTDWVLDSGRVDMGRHDTPPSASVTCRNAGTNPLSYAAAYRPVLGTDYFAVVDLRTTGHDYAVLAGYLSPLTLTLGTGQAALVDPSGPECFGFPLGIGPVAIITTPIPSDPTYAGFRIYTQAAHLGGVVPFALSNAQDLVIGF